MKFFSVGIEQRQRHSWDVHSDEIVQVRNEVKPFVRVGRAKTGISGKKKSPVPSGERVRNRLVGTTERTVARVIEASGNRFVVKDRDGHPRGWYPTVEEAEAKAGDDGTVFDRVEGRNLNRKKRSYDILDPGVDDDVPDEWTVGA